ASWQRSVAAVRPQPGNVYWALPAPGRNRKARASVRSRAGGLHHLRPDRSLLRDEGGELLLAAGPQQHVSLARLAVASGDLRTSLRVAFSLSMMAAGVPGGAMMPAQGLPGKS